MTTPQTWIPTGGSTDIFAGTVYAGQIAAGAIGTAELAAGSIVADKIAVGAIGAVAIAAGAITADKIAAGAITAAKIAADAIVAGNIAAGAIGTDELAARAITADKIAAGAITATEIAARSVTADRIVANAITAAEIAANTITADKLNVADVQAAVVTAARINALSLSAVTITGGSISGVSITGGTITGGLIRTASSGRRVELSSALGDRINFETGNSAQIYPGQILVGGSTLTIYGPCVNGSGQAPALFLSDGGDGDGEIGFWGALKPYQACASGTSDDGVWINDLNSVGRRWKLYMTNAGGSYQLVARYGPGGSEVRTIGP